MILELFANEIENEFSVTIHFIRAIHMVPEVETLIPPVSRIPR